MLTKANITWMEQVAKMANNGKISFENAVQRGYVWNKNRQSLLISSLLLSYPVPPLYARKREDGVYDMLDGKQRLTTIKRYLNNEFALEGIGFVTMMVNGEEVEVDLDGYKYEDLPNDLKDDLDAASLTIYYYDSITDDEVAEMFFRLNWGVPMNSALLTRVRATSKDAISKLGQHPIFTTALTKKAREAYTNEDMVIKAAYLMSDHDNLETKNIQTWISENEIDSKLQNKVYCALSRLESVVKIISDRENNGDEERDNKKIVKKILTKTHFLSLLPIMDKANEEKVKDEVLAKWLLKFYGPEDKCTISNKYNDACGSGSCKKEAVTTRYSELEKSYNKYVVES